MGRKISDRIEKHDVEIVYSDGLDRWNIRYHYTTLCSIKVNQHVETYPRLDDPRKQRRVTVTKLDFYFYDKRIDTSVYIASIEWRKPLKECLLDVVRMIIDDNLFTWMKNELVSRYYHPALDWRQLAEYEFTLSKKYYYDDSPWARAERLVLIADYLRDQFSKLG